MQALLKILAVDDDFINLKLLHSLLKRNNLVGQVVEASNGLEALNILKSTPDIHLVLLDIKMPVMDGIEFLINIQAMESFQSLPVIVLTTDETRKHEAFEKGAFDFLVKPIRENDLAQKILRVYELYATVE